MEHIIVKIVTATVTGRKERFFIARQDEKLKNCYVEIPGSHCEFATEAFIQLDKEKQNEKSF